MECTYLSVANVLHFELFTKRKNKNQLKSRKVPKCRYFSINARLNNFLVFLSGNSDTFNAFEYQFIITFLRFSTFRVDDILIETVYHHSTIGEFFFLWYAFD